MNALLQLRNSVFLLAVAAVLCGCAPSLQLTVEHRDGAGNLINSYLFKPSNTKDVTIKNIQPSHTFNAFVTAEYSEGLEEVYIVVSGSCYGPGVNSQIGYSIPPTGNAIPPGQNPTKFSFNDKIGTTCNRPNLTLNASAVAVGAPSKNSGRSTVRTSSLILQK
jgi:hypothetical protein